MFTSATNTILDTSVGAGSPEKRETAGGGPPSEGRLAHLGHLVGGFAHEIKNPLSTIALQLELLKEEWAAGQGAREQRACKKIDLLQREVRRLQDILEEFLRYVR